MQDAFSWSALRGYDWIITMDCDEQHEPRAIPEFLTRIAANESDVISGSRYMNMEIGADSPPPDRRSINMRITEEINRRLRLGLTDSFCGFKAYRVSRIAEMPLTEDGYAFPMQFWVQAVSHGLRIREIPVKLIYNDPNRSFGGPLDDPSARLGHYRRVLHCELERCRDRLPPSALRGAASGCGCE
jgi:dolichol-phosphate mannosyltransferase